MRSCITLAAVLALSGCADRSRVVVSTGTVLGFEVGQNPATQAYHAKLGYVRSEVALIPSNKASTTNEANFKNGATDTADVLMELRFEDLLKGGGLYQRLAVGSVAVRQPGASMMFAKDPKGTLDPATAQTIVSGAVPINPESSKILAELSARFKVSGSKQDWNAVAAEFGAPNWTDWALSNPSPADAAKMQQQLKQKGLIP